MGDVLDSARTSVRLARISAIGVANGRPDLLARLGETTSGLTDLRRSGLLRADVEPRAVAAFISSYALGMVVVDLDARPADWADIAEVIGHFADSLTAL
jgi:hypothetical protein